MESIEDKALIKKGGIGIKPKYPKPNIKISPQHRKK